MTAEFPLAVHAMVYLLHTSRITSSQELAENICTNPARVRKVMRKLHEKGLVEAKRGQGSGYKAKKGSHKITLKAIIEVLDEKPIDINWHSGNIDKNCLVSSGMGEIMDDIYFKMNSKCAEFLSEITIGSIKNTIFKSKDI